VNAFTGVLLDLGVDTDTISTIDDIADGIRDGANLAASLAEMSYALGSWIASSYGDLPVAEAFDTFMKHKDGAEALMDLSELIDKGLLAYEIENGNKPDLYEASEDNAFSLLFGQDGVFTRSLKEPDWSPNYAVELMNLAIKRISGDPNASIDKSRFDWNPYTDSVTLWEATHVDYSIPEENYFVVADLPEDYFDDFVLS